MPKVMIIDDDEAIRRSLKILLEAEGYEVVTSSSGKEGYWEANEELPDIILLDIMMPEATGNIVLGKLKNNEATKDTPVIILSGLTNVGLHKDVVRLGAVHWLTKPFDSTIVLQTVERVLAGRPPVPPE